MEFLFFKRFRWWIRQATGGAGWRVDAYRAGSSPTLGNGSQLPSCVDRNSKQIHTWGQSHDRVIGSRYRPRYYPCLPNAVGVASIGTKMGGERWGNLLLPVQLWPTQCRWHTDSFLFWPLLVDAAGWGEMAALPIPYDPQLIGFRICDQPAIFDALANVLGIVPGPSVCFTFGSALHTAMASRHTESKFDPGVQPTLLLFSATAGNQE